MWRPLKSTADCRFQAWVEVRISTEVQISGVRPWNLQFKLVAEGIGTRGQPGGRHHWRLVAPLTGCNKPAVTKADSRPELTILGSGIR